jgi:SPX domain protein involved in polyphosphate accumulation
MAFLDYFIENIKSEWRFYYVDYEKLIDLIKPKSYPSKEYEEINEARFIEEIESELQKVRREYYNFRHSILKMLN